MVEITNEMRKALNFIRDTKITMSEWRRNGKAAYGKPPTWNQFRMAGDGAMLTIDVETQVAIRPLTKVGTADGSMFVLNSAGEAALARAA